MNLTAAALLYATNNFSSDLKMSLDIFDSTYSTQGMLFLFLQEDFMSLF